MVGVALQEHGGLGLARIRGAGRPNVADRPDPIDLLVSKRLRQRREFMEITQQEMADRMKLSRSQYIKYEDGRNRLAASRLHEAAEILDIGVEWFFNRKAEERGEPETMPPDKRALLAAYDAVPAARRSQAFKAALGVLKTLAA